ncbi:hypothetical protein [Pilimelia columellifera]|uniref:hypothetical protein n=1 Tax=Pilimelia columellifera TaxID=706574 RepID=UPI0031D4533B
MNTRTALAGSALAAIAAMAMSACAPVGGDGVAQQPVANQAANPDDAAADDGDVADEDAVDEGASADDAAGDDAAGDAADDAGDAGGENADQKLTTQLIARDVKRMGRMVTDDKGWVLYRFEKDTPDPAKSNCKGDCEKVWPPAYTDGDPELTGIDEETVGTVTRDDGSKQLTLGGWPVYRYVGDKKPGQWTGQGVGGVWFVVDPDGKKNLSCLPKGTPKAVAPPSGGGGY